ncbi:MAG: PIN domain-containing protein [Candidatus Omnitrophota bacterium]|nr:PIN domain-containing protein [Candidatus Omnitrophota bacterium]
MIVYVESNFVLELSYLQEQHASCERIVQLAESKQLALVLPAFSLSEPYDSFIRRHKRRRVVLARFQKESRELGRSLGYSALASDATNLGATLIASLDEEKARLDRVVLRLLRCAATIPTSPSVLDEAVQAQQDGLFRGPHDAIVYAAVRSHLQAADPDEKCFLNRNRKDFADPDVDRALRQLGCTIVFGFDNGLGHIQSRLTSE